MRKYFANPLRKVSLVTILLSISLSVGAQVSVSGFSTLGFAISDSDDIYLRYASEKGTFQRDSVLGLQIDAGLTQRTGVTVQSKIAQATNSDSKSSATLSWAFLYFRPTDDVLIRLGRLRVPTFLNSENTDVGYTYDFARLPIEVYSISPNNDINGVSIIKSWTSLSGNEWELHGYGGFLSTFWRVHGRDSTPNNGPSGPWFIPIHVKSTGLVLSLRRSDDTYRLGIHHTSVKMSGVSNVTSFPFSLIAPGVGYYQLTGPGVDHANKMNASMLTLGADVAFSADIHSINECMRRKVSELSGIESIGCYTALSKGIDSWTPYIYLAKIKSSSKALQTYDMLNKSSVPLTIPGAELINLSQRLAADSIVAYDQTTLAMGITNTISLNTKLKIEWSQTKVGKVSSFVDVKPGEDSAGKRINLFSISYNVIF